MEEVERVFSTNTFGALRMTKGVLPKMIERRMGLIVTVGSVAGDLPPPFTGIYSGSKAATHFITETLKMECEPFGVDVMLVIPAAVRSNVSAFQVSLQFQKLKDPTGREERSRRLVHASRLSLQELRRSDRRQDQPFSRGSIYAYRCLR